MDKENDKNMNYWDKLLGSKFEMMLLKNNKSSRCLLVYKERFNLN